MNEIYFPGLNEFYQRYCAALSESGCESDYLDKWGLETQTDIFKIMENNVQGGFESHKYSMLSGFHGGSILNIGPGMGYCVFLLSELYDRVYVAEPDGENCSLLKSMAACYRTHRGRKGNEIIEIINGGIGITDEAVRYWETKSALMKKRNLKGSILNFNIRGSAELKNIFHEKVSRIYLHKVLSSLSIAFTFENITSECILFLDDKGEITWSEPEYIFTDILGIVPDQQLSRVLEPVLDPCGLSFDIQNYELSSGEQGDTTVEQWIFLKAWRKNNAAE